MKIQSNLLTLAVLLASILTVSAADTVKVFILAGQSNMEGKADQKLIDHQATDAKTKDLFKHLRTGDSWTVRDDVFIKFLKLFWIFRFKIFFYK